jgi:hypothetical protein
MMILFPELSQDLRDKAESLESIGNTLGDAWQIDDALKVIDQLHASYPDVILLGGDIVKKTDENNFSSTYDNWYYEPQNIPSDPDKSVEKAKEYLDLIKSKAGDGHLYVDLVVPNEWLDQFKSA